MKYTYNAERDRIARKVGDPSFSLIIYEDTLTKETRALYLHTCTNKPSHVETIAEKYCNENEVVKEINAVTRKKYEEWLYEEEVLEINNSSIPRRYITDFLIAEDTPVNGKNGNLTLKRHLLQSRDDNLLQEIEESFEKAKETNDIVRIAPDPEIFKDNYEL